MESKEERIRSESSVNIVFFFFFFFSLLFSSLSLSTVAPPQTSRNSSGDPFDNDTLPQEDTGGVGGEGVGEKPEGLDEITWARAQDARAAKMTSEQQIKKKQISLAELVTVTKTQPKQVQRNDEKLMKFFCSLARIYKRVTKSSRVSSRASSSSCITMLNTGI